MVSGAFVQQGARLQHGAALGTYDMVKSIFQPQMRGSSYYYRHSLYPRSRYTPTEPLKVYGQDKNQEPSRLGRRKVSEGFQALVLGLLAMNVVPLPAPAKVVYGEDITEPSLDRDFAPDELVQADLAWEQFRTRKRAGLANAMPSKPNMSPSRYLSIIYALKEQSFDDLKDYVRRAVKKDTVTQMQAEFRRMDVSLVQEGFDEMRQAMYYLPLAVAQRNAALGFNLQRRYNVVEEALETLDRDINMISYGRSDITNEDVTVVKQSLNDLEVSTNMFTEYATNVVASLSK